MSFVSGNAASPVDARMNIEGTYNFREVRMTTTDGVPMRPGTLFRSDALHRLTDAGLQELKALGLKLVLDLRSEDEVRAEPDALGNPGVAIKELPLMSGSVKDTMQKLVGSGPIADPLAAMYRLMLESDGATLGEAVRVIAEAGGPVDVHCTAGKDRTGLVVALTLLAIGVSEDDVIVNYALSGANLAGEWLDGMRARVESYGITLEGPLLEIISQRPASAMRAAIAWMHEHHGSPEAYLDSIGIDPVVRGQLENALLERA